LREPAEGGGRRNLQRGARLCASLLLALLAWNRGSRLGGELALIWTAHIAMDRLLGFGLKYQDGFKPTHIQSAAVYRQM
jgi:hypothetical protein